MPFTHSGLWIPRQISTKKAGAFKLPPHRLTLVLGLISTLLTTGTIMVGILTLRETNRNFNLSNQAFITVRNLSHKFDGPDRLDTSFDLENTGLTLVECFTRYALFQLPCEPA